MRISDWSSDVCSSDLLQSGDRAQKGGLAAAARAEQGDDRARGHVQVDAAQHRLAPELLPEVGDLDGARTAVQHASQRTAGPPPTTQAGSWLSRSAVLLAQHEDGRSEEHTSELQSLMRNSY